MSQIGEMTRIVGILNKERYCLGTMASGTIRVHRTDGRPGSRRWLLPLCTAGSPEAASAAGVARLVTAPIPCVDVEVVGVRKVPMLCRSVTENWILQTNHLVRSHRSIRRRRSPVELLVEALENLIGRKATRRFFAGFVVSAGVERSRRTRR